MDEERPDVCRLLPTCTRLVSVTHPPVPARSQVHADMRFWEAPEQTDILVSELLGSFGDNELSPECLDGAQRFLKPDGVSIPQSYTSYLAPMTSFKLFKDCKGYKVRVIISISTSIMPRSPPVGSHAPTQ